MICVLSRDLNTAAEKTLEQLAPPLPVKLLLASREELCVLIVSRGRGSLPLGGEHSSLLSHLGILLGPRRIPRWETLLPPEEHLTNVGRNRDDISSHLNRAEHEREYVSDRDLPPLLIVAACQLSCGGEAGGRGGR